MQFKVEIQKIQTAYMPAVTNRWHVARAKDGRGIRKRKP
jgi:hypothetical protein